MYCKNCGNPMTLDMPRCIRCGSPEGRGRLYCPACGALTPPTGDSCPNCGCGLEAAPAPRLKSRRVAGILAILGGGIGLHNFYLGYTGRAVAQLLMTVLSLAVLFPVSAVWGIVEGVQYLTGKRTADAEGRPLK